MRGISDYSPYYFHVQESLPDFWSKYHSRDRRTLFIFGLGFDPRCVPALKHIAALFSESGELTTFCARFTNLWDRELTDNQRYTRDCLDEIRRINEGLSGSRFQHHEVEVKLFSTGRKLIGDNLLISEFDESCGNSLESYTDIIIDVSAFPRSLMYSLLAHLWRKRRRGQNLFAVLTESPIRVDIEETDFHEPAIMLGEYDIKKTNYRLWIPVLGAKAERLQTIYEFLQPTAVFPIVPFPSRDPRIGDEICLRARRLFDDWKVPFENVMYSSGDVPFDVFRKIQDVVASYEDFVPDLSIVVSALSGRSLSLGVLLAALWSDLAVCHTQPATYRINQETRDKLHQAVKDIIPTIYWLDGQLYELTIGVIK